jgi:hypothetical protein
MGWLARITQEIRNEERRRRLQEEHDKIQAEMNQLCFQCWLHDAEILKNKQDKWRKP